MAFTHTISEKVTTPGGNVNSETSYSAGLEVNLDEAIADASTDLQVTVTLDVSEVKSFYIVSDQDITLETNSGGAPIDTLNLKKNEPYLWHTGSLDTFKLGTDVTAFFFTNASGATANVKMRCVVDPTP